MPETPEEQIRKQVTELVEESFSPEEQPIHNLLQRTGIPIQDFTPYLLLKMLERLESIEETLDILNGSITDLWNSKYNS